MVNEESRFLVLAWDLHAVSRAATLAAAVEDAQTFSEDTGKNYFVVEQMARIYHATTVEYIG